MTETVSDLVPKPVGPSLAYARVGTRFVAAIIDAMIIILAGFLVSLLIRRVLGISVSDTARWSLSIVGSVYGVYFIGRKGQTPGKKAMRIKVVEAVTGQAPGYARAFLREVVGKSLSSLVLELGYLWAIWDKKKQAWHDKITGTVVVKV